MMSRRIDQEGASSVRQASIGAGVASLQGVAPVMNQQFFREFRDYLRTKAGEN